MRTTRASSAPADPCDDDAGLCWLGGNLSFFEEHTTAVCSIARLRIQRRRLLRLPTITTLCGHRRGAAESRTRKCPWRAEASRPDGGPTPPMDEAMACTVPRYHTTTINYCESRVLDQMPASCLQHQGGSPWIQRSTTATQFISKQNRRDGPQPGSRPAHL